MEREYEEAVTDIKAAIFDVVDSEKKTNASLSDIINNEVDDDKKEELSKILHQKKEILDTLLSNIGSIIDSVEMLEKINYDNNLKTDYIKSKVEITNIDDEEDASETDDDEEDASETDNEEIEEVEEPDEEESDEEEKPEEDEEDVEIEEPIITVEEEESEEETEEETESENNELEDIVDIKEDTEESDEGEKETEDESEEPVLTEIKSAEEKFAFNKEDKTAPRAIMIIEAQAKKLKDSYDSQLNKVKSIGLFNDYDYDNSTKNTLKGDIINQDVASRLNLEGKSIEDLTVLKQVYSDEGEVEAVKVIEAKMRELEGGEETSETNTDSK